MKKLYSREPSTLKALIETILIILIVPLPLAFYMSGIDWVTRGFLAVPEEFLVTYLLELGILVIGIVVFKIKEKLFSE